jgi:fibronectin-binding autotransporter adhesin
MKRKNSLRMYGAVIAALAARTAGATTYTWLNPGTSGNLSDPTQWDNGMPASDPSTQLIFNPGNYNVTVDYPQGGPTFNFNSIAINNTTGNTFGLIVGSFLDNLSPIGTNPSISLSGSGNANIQAALLFQGPATITNFGSGNLQIHTQNFSTGTVATYNVVNYNNVGTGTYQLSDATLYYGLGTMNLNNSGGGLFQIGNTGPTNLGSGATIVGSGFNGNVNVANGPVIFGGNTSGDLFGNYTFLNVSAGASFNFNGNPETMGGILGSGTIIMGTAGSISVVAPGDRTFSGSLTGSATFTQNSPGTFNIMAANALSPTGLTTIANGNINLNGYSQVLGGLSGGNTVGTLALGSSTLTIDPAATGNYIFAVGLSGTGNLVINGPGVQSLIGNNTYTGTTTVTQGTLRYNVASLLTAGSTATFAAGSALDAIVPVNASAGTYFNGTGAFAKEGAGTLTFSTTNANFAPSSVTVLAGTIALDQSTDTGNKIGTVPVALVGGNLSVTGSAGTAITQTLTSLAIGLGPNNGGSSAVQVNALGGQPVTLNVGTITRGLGSSVDFQTAGSGTATILASNTTTNGILGGWATVNNGSDFANVTGGAITATNNYSTTVGTGVNTLISGPVAVSANTTTGSLKFDAAIASTVTTAASTTLNLSTGGILVPANVGANADLITGGSLKAAANTDLVVNQYNTAAPFQISSVIVNTAGTASTQSATYTATGSTSTGAVITVGSTAGIYVGELVTGTNIPSGSRVQSISSPTSFALTNIPTGAQTGATLTFTPGTDLVKTGPGTLVLGTGNSYSGGTYINGGTVSVASYTQSVFGAQSSPLYINGGTLLINSGSQTFNNSSHPLTVGPAGATLNFNTSESFYGNGLNGTGTLTFNGSGQVSVGTNASTFSGNMVFANGSNGSLRETSSQLTRASGLFLGNTSAFQITDDATANFGIAPGAPVVLAGGSGPAGSTTPGAIVLTDQSPTGVNSGSGIFVVPNTTLTNPFTFQADTTIGVYNAASTSPAGNPLRQAQLTLPNPVTGAGNLIKVGSGVLVLASPSNSFGNGAGTVIVGNGTLRDGVDNGVPAAAILQLGQTGQTTSGVFDLGGFNQTVAGFSTVGSGTANGVINSNAAGNTTTSTLTTRIAAGNSQTFNGQLGGGTVGNESVNGFSLTKTGLGTLTLAGINTFNGPATVLAGALRVTETQNTARAYAVADGASLIVTNTDPSQSPLQATTLNVGNSASSNLTFELDGSGIPGSGLLQVTTPGGLTTAGTVNVAVTTTNALFTNQEIPLIDYTGAIAGAGFSAFNTSVSLQSRATGTLVNNTSNGSIDLLVTSVDFLKYTGAINGNWDINTTPNFKLNSSSAATTYLDSPPDAVVFDDTAVGTHTVNLTTVLHPAIITVNSAAGYTFTGAGSIAGSTPIVVNGPGALTVLTNDTNTGTTTINAGSVVVGNGTTAGSLGTGAIVDNGQLTYNRSDAVTLASNITGTGSFTHAGTGTITLAGANSIGGNLTVTAGTLAVTGTTTVGGTLSSPTAVAVSGGLQIGAGGPSGTLAADVAFTNAGTLTFSNSAGTSDANNLAGAGNIVVASGSAKLTGTVAYTGLTTLGDNTIEYGSNTDTTLNNSITGSNIANIVKSGTGTLYLLGSSNGFTGTLTINQGKVVLDDLGASGDLGAASIVINNGTEFQFGPDNNPDLPDNTVVTINAGGVFALETGENYGGFVLNGGTYIGGNGTATAQTSNNVDSDFNLQAGSITSNGSGASLLGGTNPVDKYSAGTVTFSGSVGISSAIAVNIHQGILAFGGANIPTSGQPVTLGDSGTVGELDVTDTVPATTSRPFLVNGNGGIINVLSVGGSLALTGGIGGGAGLTVGGLGMTTFNASSQPVNFSGDTSVTGGKLVLIGSNALPGTSNLNIAAGAIVQVQQLSTKSGTTTTVTTSVIQSNSVNITPSAGGVAGGVFDLTRNDLVLHNQSLASVTALVARGYNLTGGANWQGSGGITSSAAASDSGHLTAVGVIANTIPGGTQLYGNGTSFDGYNPSGGDVLLKYSYFGDANLDGKVDGSDYSLIDAGYAGKGALTGWYNGDFNYDGVVDGSDYALIDNAFNNQTPSPAAGSAALVAAVTKQVAGTTPAAVPEPASVFLIVLAAGTVARRRRLA